MQTDTIMGWIDSLPNVRTDLLAHRDQLQFGIDEAARLEWEAAQLRAQVMSEQKKLLGEIAKRYPLHEIEQASNRYRKANQLGADILDQGLRNALTRCDGNVGPKVALEIYEQEVLKDHTKLIEQSTGETLQLLTKLIDWWVYAGEPIMRRLST